MPTATSNTEAFTHDVLLSHSAKDKAVVRASSLSASIGERAGVRCRSPHLAERSRGEDHSSFGLRTSDFGFAKPGPFRFRDPLNQERRFIPLRLATLRDTLLPKLLRGELRPWNS